MSWAKSTHMNSYNGSYAENYFSWRLLNLLAYPVSRQRFTDVVRHHSGNKSSRCTQIMPNKHWEGLSNPQWRATQSLASKNTLPDPPVLWWWTRNSSGHGVYFSLMSSKQYFPEYLPPVLIYDFMCTLQCSPCLQAVSGNDNEIPIFLNRWFKDISLGWGFSLWIPASKLYLTQGQR